MAFLLLVPSYLTVPNNLKSVIDNRDTIVQLLKRKNTHIFRSITVTHKTHLKKKKKKGEESSLHLCMCGKFTSYINQCHTILTQGFSPTELQEIIGQVVRMADIASLSTALSVLPGKSQT